jgi:steroid 5-alpha reductase family enzyme
LKFSRAASFLIIIFIYLFSFVAASVILFLSANYLSLSAWLLIFELGILLTIFVFIGSLLFNNASVYDPFWSIYPVALLMVWIGVKGEHAIRENVLIIIAILFWSIRLTLNWARAWKGLQHEDWRYVQLKNQNGKLFPLVNFFGIHLFPTLLVSLGMIPAYFIFFRINSADSREIIPFLICIAAAVIELIADEQQRFFKLNRKTPNEFIQTGLWKFSRHPNYFGEILFWWGIYFFTLSSNPQYWWTGIGAVAMTCLFVFISIPLMEKHMLEKNPDYKIYQATVAALVPGL